MASDTEDANLCANKSENTSIKRTKKGGPAGGILSNKTKRFTRQMGSFTREDDEQMLNYLIRTNSVRESLNIATWLRLEEVGTLAPHRAGPLFMHFINDILPNYNTYEIPKKKAYHDLRELHLLQAGFPTGLTESQYSDSQTPVNGLPTTTTRTTEQSSPSAVEKFPQKFASQVDKLQVSQVMTLCPNHQTSPVPPAARQNLPAVGKKSPDSVYDETQFSPGDKAQEEGNRSPQTPRTEIKSERLTPENSSPLSTAETVAMSPPPPRIKMERSVSNECLEEPERPVASPDELLEESHDWKCDLLPGGSRPYVATSSDSEESTRAPGDVENPTELEANQDLTKSGDVLVHPKSLETSFDSKKSRETPGSSESPKKPLVLLPSSAMNIDFSDDEQSPDLRKKTHSKNSRSRKSPTPAVSECSSSISFSDESEDSETVSEVRRKNRRRTAASPEISPLTALRNIMKNPPKRMTWNSLAAGFADDENNHSSDNSPEKESKSSGCQKEATPVRKRGKYKNNSGVKKKSVSDVEVNSLESNSPLAGTGKRTPTSTVSTPSTVRQKSRIPDNEAPEKSGKRKFPEIDSNDSDEDNFRGKETQGKRSGGPQSRASTSGGVKGRGAQRGRGILRGKRAHAQRDDEDSGNEAQWTEDQSEDPSSDHEGDRTAREAQGTANKQKAQVETECVAPSRGLMYLGDAMGRKAFSKEEDQAMVDALIDHNLIYRATSINAWQGLLDKGVRGIGNRTAKSLRNHFSNYVRWNYKHFTNDPDAIEAFVDAERRRGARHDLRKAKAEIRKLGSPD